ncbi:uncharacterized protein N7483_011539 [Penicillium malachiteum]|uniref:uncharacterized protein n=1 Tax=Penicillium malachiteum TaxID=1324776 RepID=UPI0025479191|nr:uncharacterized protein N7483_011539 [Penicillium malachiteum]KAJ5714358.1 hypothetical protein N7483_011539 [Penicillium malachiteum]
MSSMDNMAMQRWHQSTLRTANIPQSQAPSCLHANGDGEDNQLPDNERLTDNALDENENHRIVQDFLPRVCGRGMRALYTASWTLKLEPD